MYRGSKIAICISVAFLLFFWYLAAHSFYDVSTATKNNKTIRYCIFVKDNAIKKCCVKLGEDYRIGGSADNKQEVDTYFKKCILDGTHNKTKALIAYGMVRVVGVPYVASPWRWGYGWQFGRGYR